MSKKMCGTCQWYEGEKTGGGVCRARPPQAVPASWGEAYGVWPTVNPERDWCGRWQEAGRIQQVWPAGKAEGYEYWRNSKGVTYVTRVPEGRKLRLASYRDITGSVRNGVLVLGECEGSSPSDVAVRAVQQSRGRRVSLNGFDHIEVGREDGTWGLLREFREEA